MAVWRIHITGAAGAGTTTVGQRLAARLNCAHFNTDAFYWLPSDPPYQVKRAVEQRLVMLHAALAGQKAWVLSGSLDGWGDPLIPLFDVVVFLSVPTEVRLARLRQREQERYGADIAEGGKLHKQHQEFLVWAASYDSGVLPSRNRRRHLAWLAKLTCPVIMLAAEKSVDLVLSELHNRITALQRVTE